jgi:hypothetical protein
MNDVINHKTNNCIWYHTTPDDKIDKIIKEGLKINSKPSWQSKPEPWIYVSTMPWKQESSIILEVDLSFLNQNECGWAFADENTPIEELWQLRVFRDIETKYLTIYNQE